VKTKRAYPAHHSLRHLRLFSPTPSISSIALS